MCRLRSQALLDQIISRSLTATADKGEDVALNIGFIPKRRYGKLGAADIGELKFIEARHPTMSINDLIKEVKRHTTIHKIASDLSIGGNLRAVRKARLANKTMEERMEVMRGSTVTRLREAPIERRVEIACDSFGCSYKWLSEQVGTYPVNVTRWVKGQLPKIDQAMKIAKAFNMSTDEFWGSGSFGVELDGTRRQRAHAHDQMQRELTTYRGYP